jgi:hypothetical protein
MKFTIPPFSVTQPGPHGDTIHSHTPKLDALKQAAYIQNMLGRRYSLTDHGDGAITVQGDGLAALTFSPGTLTVSGA